MLLSFYVTLLYKNQELQFNQLCNPKVVTMKVINMREAKSKLSSLIKSKETIIVTIRNKPVARIESISPIEASLVQAQEAFREIGISEEDALEILEKAR